ncbi:microcephalin-like [Artemia franciscana]|uniref:BRCT domain-containing protein n=1 Tax=Artemia franciscana TaxID=6661 RepID=A0AA88HWL5_ARTSF|nr:hypothetical protein QYM36_009384 [Artemia franciscana]
MLSNCKKIEQWLEEDFNNMSPCVKPMKKKRNLGEISKEHRKLLESAPAYYSFLRDRTPNSRKKDKRDDMVSSQKTPKNSASKIKGRSIDGFERQSKCSLFYDSRRKFEPGLEKPHENTTPKSVQRYQCELKTPMSSRSSINNVSDLNIQNKSKEQGKKHENNSYRNTPEKLHEAKTPKSGLPSQWEDKTPILTIPIAHSINDVSGLGTQGKSREKGKENTNDCARNAEELSGILKGVVAYVDVRGGADNRSEAFRILLKDLGARVSLRLTKNVTHVIFKEGLKSTFIKAKALEVHLVSTLWVKECQEQMRKVSESQFAPINLEQYDSPFFPSLKKKRFILPRKLEEDLEYATMLQKRQLQRSKKKLPVTMDRIPIDEEKTPFDEEEVPGRKPLSALQILEMLSPGTSLQPRLNNDKDSSLSDTPPPLAARLYAEILRESEQKAADPDLSGIKPLDKTKELSLNDSFSELNSRTRNSSRESNDNIRPVALENKESYKRRRLFAPQWDSVLIVPKTPEDSSSCKIASPYKDSSLFKGVPIKSKNANTGQNLEVPGAEDKSMDLIKKRNGDNEQVKEVLAKHKYISRKSLEDFKLEKRPTKINSADDSTPSIVCTSLHHEQIELVHSVVAKLKKFRIIKKPDSTTTHIVCGSPRRTLNLLHGLVRGCWIVSFSWVLESIEKERWTDEESFEMVEFSECIREFRILRQKNGLNFSLDLFKSLGPLYISKNSVIPCWDLTHLVRLAGGEVVDRARDATIIIGMFYRNELSVCIDPTWVLDSIQKNCIQNLELYRITSS